MRSAAVKGWSLNAKNKIEFKRWLIFLFLKGLNYISIHLLYTYQANLYGPQRIVTNLDLK